MGRRRSYQCGRHIEGCRWYSPVNLEGWMVFRRVVQVTLVTNVELRFFKDT